MILDKIGQLLAQFFGETTKIDPIAKDQERSSDFLDPDYLSDLLFYRIYDEERKIYENKTSFGFVIEVIPLMGAGIDAQQEISNLVRDIGEEGASIQTILWADPRTDRFLTSWSEPRLKRGGMFEQVAKKKLEFLKKEAIAGDPPSRIFRFLFSYSEPKRSKTTPDITLSKIVEKKKKAIETFSRVSQCFAVEPQQLLEIVSGLVNFERSTTIESRRWRKETWLSKQMGEPGSAIECFRNGLIFRGKTEDTQFKSYEVTDYPEEWSISHMGELIGDFLNRSYRIPSPFYLHYGIFFPSQSNVEMKLAGKRKVLGHQIKFPSLVRMFPEMPREYEENLFVSRQVQDGEKFIETRFSCGLWSKLDQFTSAESSLVALFQKYGFKLKENHFIHLPEFLSSLPMAWGEESTYIRKLQKARCFRTTISSEVGSLIPIVADWWGNSTKGMIFSSRRGQIASWDPFCIEGNLNTVIIGPSGSGKSVFIQDLIFSHLGQGGKVYVLDLGRSFEKLCRLLDGQYLEFSQKSQLNLNPFACVQETGDPDALNTALEMVSSIIATMAMPTHQIDKERSDILNSCVKKVWEKKGRKATVDDVIDCLGDLTYRSELMVGAAESLKEGLRKFGVQGVFSPYFYGEDPVDFSKELVVIETEELKNLADLQAVVLQIFTLAISNQIFMGNRERRSLICIDEAWDLLKSPQMEGFIESLARRLRKYNGALIIGTQGLKDFERSPGARAAFHNSNWLIMLGRDADSINTIKQQNLISMNSFKETALNSLRMEEGKFSELFLYHKGSDFFTVSQLKLDPFSSMLYSTKAVEFQAVQELCKSGLKVEAAIDWMTSHRNLLKQLLDKGQTVSSAIQIIKQGETDDQT